MIATLHAEVIATRRDVERLRHIRNACRMGYAHDQREISSVNQWLWWKSMQGQVRARLYYESGQYNVLVGYGLIRETDDARWWLSLGVLPEYRGRGHGTAITADVARWAGQRVWSHALSTNIPAQRIHRVEDWEEWERNEVLVSYRTREHVWQPT